MVEEGLMGDGEGPQADADEEDEEDDEGKDCAKGLQPE